MRSSVPFRLALVLALAACGREAVKTPQSPPPVAKKPAGPQDDAAERENLLNYAHGAVVVWRSAEASLKSSPVRAIDGERDMSSTWSSPPHDSQQTLVFALPSRSRLTRVGAENGPANQASKLRFEASLDGEHFTELATVDLEQREGAQLFDVKPVEAVYLRVSTLDVGRRFVELKSIHARGTPIDPAQPGPIAGCWMLDTRRGSFAQHGAHAAGRIEDTSLDGGSDGRFYRFAWIRGPEYGLAAISVTSDGKHLSGISWHEESQPQFVQTTWVGTPCGTAADQTGDDVFRAFIDRLGRYPLYGLRFDPSGQLIEKDSAFVLDRLAAFMNSLPPTANRLPIRLVAYELLQPTSDRNRDVAHAKLDSLGVALIRRGVDPARIEIVNKGAQSRRPAPTEATRSLYGTVEIEVRR